MDIFLSPEILRYYILYKSDPTRKNKAKFIDFLFYPSHPEFSALQQAQKCGEELVIRHMEQYKKRPLAYSKSGLYPQILSLLTDTGVKWREKHRCTITYKRQTKHLDYITVVIDLQPLAVVSDYPIVLIPVLFEEKELAPLILGVYTTIFSVQRPWLSLFTGVCDFSPRRTPACTRITWGRHLNFLINGVDTIRQIAMALEEDTLHDVALDAAVRTRYLAEINK